MPIDELIVGYRARDPRRDAFADVYGGRCIGCGNQVWYNASAIPVLSGSDHDARIVCTWCWNTERMSIEDAM